MLLRSRLWEGARSTPPGSRRIPARRDSMKAGPRSYANKETPSPEAGFESILGKPSPVEFHGYRDFPVSLPGRGRGL